MRAPKPDPNLEPAQLPNQAVKVTEDDVTRLLRKLNRSRAWKYRARFKADLLKLFADCAGMCWNEPPAASRANALEVLHAKGVAFSRIYKSLDKYSYMDLDNSISRPALLGVPGAKRIGAPELYGSFLQLLHGIDAAVQALRQHKSKVNTFRMMTGRGITRLWRLYAAIPRKKWRYFAFEVFKVAGVDSRHPSSAGKFDEMFDRYTGEGWVRKYGSLRYLKPRKK